LLDDCASPWPLTVAVEIIAAQAAKPLVRKVLLSIKVTPFVLDPCTPCCKIDVEKGFYGRYLIALGVILYWLAKIIKANNS
jgi:hypothetical protein